LSFYSQKFNKLIIVGGKMAKKKIFNFIFLTILFITSVGAVVVSKNITSRPKLIYIDPGHGGSDGGAVGYEGICEKDIVLEIGKKLKHFLEQAGYEVLMTRTGDYDLAGSDSENRKRDDIYRRVDLINSTNCLLYVSIHANKFSDPRIYGAQVFYKANSKEAQELAESIQEAIKALLQNTDRFAKSIEDKYLIDNVRRKGCLVEVGFLSNPEEARMLENEYYQEKMAYAIFLGIVAYLDKNS
jgi:N-acetylmuramoyl-L-alanine amidase